MKFQSTNRLSQQQVGVNPLYLLIPLSNIIFTQNFLLVEPKCC